MFIRLRLLYLFLLAQFLSLACVSCNDDDADGISENSDLNDDDDADAGWSENIRETLADEKICKKKLGERIEAGKKFLPGIYHVFSYVYATNIMVNKIIDRPVKLNLWVAIGTSKNDDGDAFCLTEEDWGENGENCCAVGDADCKASSLNCIVEFPDLGGNYSDDEIFLTEDGVVESYYSNVLIPKGFDPVLTEDGKADIKLVVNITEEKCLEAYVDIKMTEAIINGTTFNDVRFRNYDIPDYSRYGYDYPENNLAVGWWERFYLGEDAEVEIPYPWQDAQANPSIITTEPVCLTPEYAAQREQ